MNEPAVFETVTGTMPLDVRHHGDGQPTDHREIHNVYGLLNDAGHLRGTATAAAERAAVRADARLVCRRPALLRPLAGRQHQHLGAFPRDDPDAHGHGPLGAAVRRQRHRRLRRRPVRRAVHPLAAGRRVLSVHAHAHDVRDARPGAVVVRDGARGDQPLGDRAALPAAAAHLQRHGGVEHDRAARDAAARARIPRRPAAPGASTTSSCSAAICCSRRCCRRRSASARSTCRRASGSTSGPAARYDGGSRRAHPGDAGEHSDLRPRRRVRLPPAGRAAHRRDGRASRSRSRSFRPPTSEAVIYEDDGETMAYAQGASMRRRFSQSRTATTTTIDVAAPEGSFRPPRAIWSLSVAGSGEPEPRDERRDRDDALHAAGTRRRTRPAGRCRTPGSSSSSSRTTSVRCASSSSDNRPGRECGCAAVRSA